MSAESPRERPKSTRRPRRSEWLRPPRRLFAARRSPEVVHLGEARGRRTAAARAGNISDRTCSEKGENMFVKAGASWLHAIDRLEVLERLGERGPSTKKDARQRARARVVRNAELAEQRLQGLRGAALQRASARDGAAPEAAFLFRPPVGETAGAGRRRARRSRGLGADHRAISARGRLRRGTDHHQQLSEIRPPPSRFGCRAN